MKRYVIQLIEDIRNAHRDQTSIGSKNPNKENSDMRAYFEEVERYLEFESENEPPFCSYCGLERISFPDADVLPVSELKDLISALSDMYLSWNISVDYPPDIDDNLKYTLLVSTLEESLMITDEGTIGVDFCECDTKSCILGDKCPCLEEERIFKVCVKDAKKWAKQTKKALLEEFIDVSNKISLEIDEEVEYTGEMFVFISNGHPGIPEMGYEIEEIMEDIFDQMAFLFRDHIEIHSVFSSDYFWKKYRSLQVLLMLKATHYKRGFFKTEPFYINDLEIIKGHPPLLSDGDVIRSLEEMEERDMEGDGELPF
jgi:hypothetical protein